MKKWIYVFAGVMLTLAGCKPTENNYKSAYDAARRSADASARLDAELQIPESGLITDEGGVVEHKEGNNIVFKYAPLKMVESTDANGELKKYNVAVAMYRMHTNAQAQVEDLRKRKYDAICVRTSPEECYVVIGSYHHKEDAEKGLEQYVKKNPKSNYVGLTGPIILVGTNVKSAPMKMDSQ